MSDFLFEILTEELPPKNLKKLAVSLLNEVNFSLNKEGLEFKTSNYYATPRRLAIIIENLNEKQQDNEIERKGPALAQAFDESGKPTPACTGFAKSCNTTPDKLYTIKAKQGEWVGFKVIKHGKNTKELMPEIIQAALKKLPIAKRMRWGSGITEFVRPVHNIVMLYGDKVISSEILGFKANRNTQGHRFLSSGITPITSPSAYLTLLKNQFVIASFSERQELIKEQIAAIVKEKVGNNAKAVINPELLDEVTGLVEWPVALCGNFDKEFLDVPKEFVISAMQDHQKYFPVVDDKQNLLPFFITISNIQSKQPEQVIKGNERVLRARLSDAAFFYSSDKKVSLAKRSLLLKNVIFQKDLGTVFDKAERVSHLATSIAKELNQDIEAITKAASITKADLTTELVGEFPELQGVAGYYYALSEKYSDEIATALKEQYLPKFSGDALPSSVTGSVLAVSDRIDTLVGIFGINKAPTGDKDPFALRRAALGLIRIFIENKLDLDLESLINHSVSLYGDKIKNKNTAKDVLNFIFDRLKNWYHDQNLSVEVFNSVSTLNITNLLDLDKRMQAVKVFLQLDEAEALSAANKRVSNILSKHKEDLNITEINESLFEQDIEKTLAHELLAKRKEIVALSKNRQYQEVLTNLAELRKPVDTYFDNVLVMAEDKKIRDNRLLLLKNLRELFLNVADIALLK